MIFTIPGRAHFAFIGLLLTSMSSAALEVCSQQSCKKAESQSLPVITDNLNRIFGFLESGDYIQLCKVNPEMTKCVSSDIGYLILGGLIVPMRGKITGYRAERIGDDLNFVADSGKASCSKSKLVFTIDEGSVILRNENSYYCNWLGVGNVMSYTELKISKIDVDRLHFYGKYKVSAIGTAVGGGEGTGSFQVTRGDAVLNTAIKKYGEIDLFRSLSAAKIGPDQTAGTRKNEGEQANIEYPKAAPQLEQISEPSTPVTQEAQTEALTQQQAYPAGSVETTEHTNVSADEKVNVEQMAAEKAEAERLVLEKAQIDRQAAEKTRADRSTGGKAKPERLTVDKVRSDRLTADKARTERLAAEKAEAERLATEKARTDRQTAEKAEAGKSSKDLSPKNDRKPTRPTVNSITDL